MENTAISNHIFIKVQVTNNPAKNILDEIKALFDIIEVLNSKIYKV